jgi:hypothetical protein
MWFSSKGGEANRLCRLWLLLPTEQQAGDQREGAERDDGGNRIVPDGAASRLGLMGDGTASVIRAMESVARDWLELVEDVAGEFARSVGGVLDARL